MDEIYTFLQNELRRMKHQNNYTDEQLAEKAGCKQSKMNSMLNNLEYFKKVEFRTLVNLFPDFFKVLIPKGTAIANGNAAASGNGVAISGNVTLGTGAVDWAGVMTAIRKDKKMCAECKLRAMDIIDESNNGGRR